MWVSPQSALGPLAMSILALASVGDELHCHLSHPLASERCFQLLTALTGLQLQSLSAPEDVSSFYSSEFFRGLEHWECSVPAHEFMGFVRLGFLLVSVVEKVLIRYAHADQSL